MRHRLCQDLYLHKSTYLNVHMYICVYLYTLFSISFLNISKQNGPHCLRNVLMTHCNTLQYCNTLQHTATYQDDWMSHVKYLMCQIVPVALTRTWHLFWALPAMFKSPTMQLTYTHMCGNVLGDAMCQNRRREFRNRRREFRVLS